MRVAATAALGLALAALSFAGQSPAAAPGDRCGEVITIATHGRTTTRYALAPGAAGPGEPMALVLLVGGGGHLALDDQGCPRALKGNSLVRSLPVFHDAGSGRRQSTPTTSAG